ncbi:MAG: 2-C-methyl-D-erythritol 2,4-cyclodiphosphate synthase [Sphaerochaeta sp.]|jgi:2-C-methyl-D-erythritol 2,4-cyclodiphosphate synthase|nr:2-C-methyl-D-erythritol 2,4-cyclodiphosphate synthase [Sphaerochaeta sp.]MDX9914250.1 2-C-methyl-D-erythritol 2,4-cyclodiphosphate synthase [Sphaerochaeta sp.]
MIRIGSGWDLHRLVPSGKPLIIGGIEIPSKKGPLAHSDGDVLIHALIDALLGALAKGDIGSHFPDTDPAYKDIDSMELLKSVLQQELPPYTIINVDATIILQVPKLRAHIDAIRENLSKNLSLPIEYISIKAKTAEQALGELGSGDAIIAQVALLISG